LVSFFYKSDTHHDWAKQQFSRLAPPLITCEAVVSEACFVLIGAGVNPSPVLDLIARGAVRVDFSLNAEIDAVARLMSRYADQPMSLADACLVRMSELQPRCAVVTLDSDFLVYRRDGRRTIPLIAPFGA
jgi:predicted nucleic acid-binding protein